MTFFLASRGFRLLTPKLAPSLYELALRLVSDAVGILPGRLERPMRFDGRAPTYELAKHDVPTHFAWATDRRRRCGSSPDIGVQTLRELGE